KRPYGDTTTNAVKKPSDFTAGSTWCRGPSRSGAGSRSSARRSGSGSKSSVRASVTAERDDNARRTVGQTTVERTRAGGTKAISHSYRTSGLAEAGSAVPRARGRASGGAREAAMAVGTGTRDRKAVRRAVSGKAVGLVALLTASSLAAAAAGAQEPEVTAEV